MQAKVKEAMMHKIENAVYSAWVEELLNRGANAVLAHRQATAALGRRMQLLKEAWLTIDWLPEEREEPLETTENPKVLDRLLKTVFHGYKPR